MHVNCGAYVKFWVSAQLLSTVQLGHPGTPSDPESYGSVAVDEATVGEEWGSQAVLAILY